MRLRNFPEHRRVLCRISITMCGITFMCVCGAVGGFSRGQGKFAGAHKSLTRFNERFFHSIKYRSVSHKTRRLSLSFSLSAFYVATISSYLFNFSVFLHETRKEKCDFVSRDVYEMKIFKNAS